MKPRQHDCNPSRRPTIRRRGLAILILTTTWSASWVSSGAEPESVYVIDQLQVGIRQGRNVSDALLKVVPTGTLLHVLERQGELARVRTTEGVEGWIDMAQLTTELPAKLKLAELQRQVGDLETQLSAAKANGQPGPRRPASRTEDGMLLSSIEPLVVGAIALAAGVLVGWAWQKNRFRRRLGRFTL